MSARSLPIPGLARALLRGPGGRLPKGEAMRRAEDAVVEWVEGRAGKVAEEYGGSTYLMMDFPPAPPDEMRINGEMRRRGWRWDETRKAFIYEDGSPVPRR